MIDATKPELVPGTKLRHVGFYVIRIQPKSYIVLVHRQNITQSLRNLNRVANGISDHVLGELPQDVNVNR
jgi:hypothetical protein